VLRRDELKERDERLAELETGLANLALATTAANTEIREMYDTILELDEDEDEDEEPQAAM
jgi:hypothetical protein